MATRISSERPKVTRVVAARPKNAHRVHEVAVTVLWTPQGGMIELRALRHKARYTIMVSTLMDRLMWADALRQAQEKRKRKGR